MPVLRNTGVFSRSQTEENALISQLYSDMELVLTHQPVTLQGNIEAVSACLSLGTLICS
jgi:hypothetical protein